MTVGQPDHRYAGYDDPTGHDPRGLNSLQRSVVTTDTPGQHIHNRAFDPADTDPEEGQASPQPLADSVRPDDLWIDTTEPED